MFARGSVFIAWGCVEEWYVCVALLRVILSNTVFIVWFCAASAALTNPCSFASSVNFGHPCADSLFKNKTKPNHQKSPTQTKTPTNTLQTKKTTKLNSTGRGVDASEMVLVSPLYCETGLIISIPCVLLTRFSKRN